MNLAIVQFGLWIMQLALMCMIVSISVALGCSLTNQTLFGNRGILWFLGCGVVFPGVLCCLSSVATVAAPAESRARKFAILMVALSSLQLLLIALSVGLSIVMPLFAMPAVAVALLLQLTFVLYLNRLSTFVQRKDLTRSTTRLLAGFVIVPVAAWAINATLFVTIGPLTLRQVGTTFLVAGLMIAVRAVTLTSAVRKALRAASHQLPLNAHPASMVDAITV